MLKVLSLLRLKKAFCLFFGQTVGVFGFACILIFSQPTKASVCTDYFAYGYKAIQQRSDEFWHELSRSYRENFFRNFKTNLADYEKSLHTHDHMKMLELLGFNFNSAKTFKVPSVREIIKKYEDYMQTLVSNGVIKKYLKPTFVFLKRETGEFFLAEYGEIVPMGFVAYTEKLDDNFYFSLIEQGKFVIGFSENVYNKDARLYNLTSLDHDLAHFTTFMQFSKIMEVLVDLAKQKKRDYPPGMNINNFFYLAFEAWHYLPEQHVQDFRSLALGLVPETPGFVSAHDIFQKLSMLSKDQFYNIATQLKRFQHRAVQYAGGAYRDVMTQQYALLRMYRMEFNNKMDIELARENPVINLLVQAQVNRLIYREKMEFVQSLSPYTNDRSYVVDMSIVANILAIMDGLTKVSVEESFRSFSEDGFVPGSALDRMYKKINLMELTNE